MLVENIEFKGNKNSIHSSNDNIITKPPPNKQTKNKTKQNKNKTNKRKEKEEYEEI